MVVVGDDEAGRVEEVIPSKGGPDVVGLASTDGAPFGKLASLGGEEKVWSGTSF